MKFVTALFLLAPFAAHASCFEDAATRYGVDAALLKSIAWQESRGHTNAVGPRLPDGNIALGEMQINTNHLDELKPYGIRRADLFNGCTSVNLGAWVLAKCIKNVGRTWNAVGCYVAGAKSKNVAAKAAYVRAVKKHYQGYAHQNANALMNATQERATKHAERPARPLTVASAASRPKMMVWGANE